jgi:neutral ceramidase
MSSDEQESVGMRGVLIRLYALNKLSVAGFVAAVLSSTQALGEAPLPLEAGLAVRDITPDPQLFHVPLGGYGERMNAAATGIHDSTLAKALILRRHDQKFAIVSLDLLGVPRSLRDEVIERIADTGIGSDNLLLAASHTHASVEMAALNRANVFRNPAIGIFDERLLVFTADRIAEAIRMADGSYEPVHAGSASVELSGLNRNRRGGKTTDTEMTILRLDRMDGTPLVVHVNYTAHPTYMTASVMELSAGWPGYLQRTLESVLPGTTCMYSNGAEGDVAPSGGKGSTPFERAESYGQQLAVHAADLVRKTRTRPVTCFRYRTQILKLPERKVPKALMQSAVRSEREEHSAGRERHGSGKFHPERPAGRRFFRGFDPR